MGTVIDAVSVVAGSRRRYARSGRKLADFAVLSDDLLTVGEDEILNTKVVATYVAGQRVYELGEAPE